TSNACIKVWFGSPQVTPAELIAKPDAEKIDGILRIGYEVPEAVGAPCGRTFEDAFILANHTLFDLATPSEDKAAEKAREEGKSDFALKYAIEKTIWKVPRYISEGLQWLAGLNQPSKVSAPLATGCATVLAT